jgi:hypothetical protein
MKYTKGYQNRKERQRGKHPKSPNRRKPRIPTKPAHKTQNLRGFDLQNLKSIPSIG